MFRFNADAIANSRAFYNTLGASFAFGITRQMQLRIWVQMQDQFDTIDMSDNEIKTLGNFPIWRRLQTLLLSNNHIRLVDKKIGKQLVSIKSLIMTNNRIRIFLRSIIWRRWERRWRICRRTTGREKTELSIVRYTKFLPYVFLIFERFKGKRGRMQEIVLE